jgi:hypothetical protein
MQAIRLFSDHQNSVKSSLKSKKWDFRDSKLTKISPYKDKTRQDKTRFICSFQIAIIYTQRNYLYLLALLLLVKYILCSVTDCFLIFEKI